MIIIFHLVHPRSRLKIQFNIFLCVFNHFDSFAVYFSWINSWNFPWPERVNLRHSTLHKFGCMCFNYSRPFGDWFQGDDNIVVYTCNFSVFALLLPLLAVSVLHKYAHTPCALWKKHILTAPFLSQPPSIVATANTLERCKVNLSVLLEQLEFGKVCTAKTRLHWDQPQ